MRDIKFRFWDGRNLWSGDRIVFPSSPEVTSASTAYSVEGFFDKINLLAWDTLQFTGLTDENGKPIFEGDILARVGMSPHKVVYRSREAQYIVEDVHGFPRSSLYVFLIDPGVEVIGNIYENPELLK